MLAFGAIAALAAASISEARAAAVPPSVENSSATTAGPVFEPSDGSVGTSARFVARGLGYTFYLSETGVVLAFSPPRARPSRIRTVEQRGQRSVDQSTRTDSPPASLTGGTPAGFALSMQFVHAKRSPLLSAEDMRQSTTNYLIGADPQQWRTNVPNYGLVRYHDLYPGIDLLVHGAGRNLEYDFAVGPSADPSSIQMALAGTDGLTIDRAGDLVERLPNGEELTQLRPRISQMIRNQVKQVSGSFRLLGGNRVGFAVGPHDASAPLLIDPVLAYSSYLGGVGNEAYGVVVDGSGNAYVTGEADADVFPTTPGAFQTNATLAGQTAYIAKFNPQGALVYATLLGGQHIGMLAPGHPAVDRSGDVYITGVAGIFCPGQVLTCADFPTTGGSFQTRPKSNLNAFVTKLNSTGTGLVYSSYLGGTGDEQSAWGPSVAVDKYGNAYVTGTTSSTDFPVTTGAFQTRLPNPTASGFLAKVNAKGSKLTYATYLGGSNNDNGTQVAVGSDGSAYVTGYTNSPDFPTTAGSFQPLCGGSPPCQSFEAFVTRVNPNGKSLLYSSFLGGGGGPDGEDDGHAIAVDSNGAAYLAGLTTSTNFPTTPTAFHRTLSGLVDAFVTKVAPDGSRLDYSTYLGGNEGPCVEDGGGDAEYAQGVAVDGNGDAFVTGLLCNDPAFPVTPDAFQKSGHGGNLEAWVTELNAAGSGLVWSSYLGGSADDVGDGVAAGTAGSAWAVGGTYSCDFPVTPTALETVSPGSQGGASYDTGYVAHITPGTASASGSCPAPQSVSSGPGSTDPTFGSGGAVTTNIAGTPVQPTEDSAHAVVQQTNADLVVGGSSATCCPYQPEFALVRYLPSGALDGTFGARGIVTTVWPSNSAQCSTSSSLSALALQSDGKIIGAGTGSYATFTTTAVSCGYTEFALARYNPDGTLDTSFGNAGRVATPFSEPDGTPDIATLTALLVQGDGKIIAVGQVGRTTDEFALVRYNTDGTLDTTFGNGGIVRTSFASATASGDAEAAALQGDGRIVVAGLYDYANANGYNQSVFGLARYNSDGSLDSTFGTGGVVATSFSTTPGGVPPFQNAWPLSVVVQPDGMIVVAGTDENHPTYNVALARYTPTGNLDTGFGQGGLVRTNLYNSEQVGFALRLQSDGKLVVAGASNCYLVGGVVGGALGCSADNGQRSYFLAERYLASGDLDGAFGVGGATETRLTAGLDYANALALQSDGRIVAAGVSNASANADFAVVRYMP